jgi:CAAX protease family protein
VTLVEDSQPPQRRRQRPPVADDPTLAPQLRLAVLPYLVHILAGAALVGIMVALGDEPPDGMEFYSPAYGLVIVGSYVALAMSTIWVAQKSGEPARVLGLVRTRLWRAVGLTAAAFVASVAIAYPLEQIFHGAESQGFEPDAYPGGAEAAVGLTLTIFGICLFGPLCEELYFRGILYGALRRFGPLLATLGSSLLFAVVHFTPAAIPVLMVIGIALALLYELTGSLWPPIAFHVLNNSLAMIGALGSDGSGSS